MLIVTGATVNARKGEEGLSERSTSSSNNWND